MADQPPMPPTTEDVPNHWGFHLLQGINRLGDKVDDMRRKQEWSTDALRHEMGGLREEVHQEIGGVREELRHEMGGLRHELGQDLIGVREELRHEIDGVRHEMGGLRQEVHQEIGGVHQEVHSLDTKLDRKLTTLQYWYWSTLVVIVVGFGSILFTRP